MKNLPLYQEVYEYDMYQYLRDHSLGSEAGEGQAAVKWKKVFQNQSCVLLVFIAHVALVKNWDYGRITQQDRERNTGDSAFS